MRNIILFWISCWSVLSFLFLPFSFSFLPDIGIGLSRLILPLNTLICSWVGVTIRQSFLVSDSLAFYSTGILLLLFSGLITALVYRKGKHHFTKIQTVFFFTLILLLAYFLIRYGLDKLFGRQFYTPASNTLHTPVGQLGKDLLFWTSMGTSSFYNSFMAITEMSAGAFLLFNRTRFLGIILSFGILLNVFAINIGFDITVKYLSGLLLISCVVCLFSYDSRLKFLIYGKLSEHVQPTLAKTWTFLLFTPFLVDLIASYWQNPPNESGKSYSVQSLVADADFIAASEVVRIHFHPKGYFITENRQQRFTSFKLSEDKRSVLINQQVVPVSITKESLLLKYGNDFIQWKVEEINLDTLPLKQDKTHWYFERISN